MPINKIIFKKQNIFGMVLRICHSKGGEKMKNEKDKKIISFEIDPELSLKLETMAYCACVSRSEFLRHLIAKRWDILSEKFDVNMGLSALIYESIAKINKIISSKKLSDENVEMLKEKIIFLEKLEEKYGAGWEVRYVDNTEETFG
jgi:hypothetical protein